MSGSPVPGIWAGNEIVRSGEIWSKAISPSAALSRVPSAMVGIAARLPGEGGGTRMDSLQGACNESRRHNANEASRLGRRQTFVASVAHTDQVLHLLTSLVQRVA